MRRCGAERPRVCGHAASPVDLATEAGTAPCADRCDLASYRRSLCCICIKRSVAVSPVRSHCAVVRVGKLQLSRAAACVNWALLQDILLTCKACHE